MAFESDPFFDRYAGEIGDFLPGPRKTVKYGSFAGIGISGQSDF